MIVLIFPYRNRDIHRIQRSLDSLANQTDTAFSVEFVDYGSTTKLSTQVQQLVSSYAFANYTYYPTHYQPWNKSRALNSVIKNLNEDFCFVADVDMIFHPEFVEIANKVKSPTKAVYFKVGFLTASESQHSKPFAEYKIKFESEAGATGLTLFPVEALKAVNGFDEFYHFWGSEDTDVHVRLQNNGLQIYFYEERMLLLHQWHVIYRNKESSQLSEELQLSGVVQLNHEHLRFHQLNNITKVNEKGWGTPLTDKTIKKIEEQVDVEILVSNKRNEFDHFLFMQLPNLSAGIYDIRISQSVIKSRLKFKSKRILGKSVPRFYSMKAINDKLLLHIICFYRSHDYIFKVNVDKKEIRFGIIIKDTVQTI